MQYYIFTDLTNLTVENSETLVESYIYLKFILEVSFGLFDQLQQQIEIPK